MVFDPFRLYDFDGICAAEEPSTRRRKRESTYPKPRHVSFSNEIGIAQIPNTNLLPVKIKSTLWYPEPTRKKKNNNNVLKLLSCSNMAGSDDVGVLCRDDDSAHSRSHFPVQAVLTEQDYQRYEMSNDPEMIAKLYRQCSLQSIARAQLRALKHEQEIQDYVQSSNNKRGTRKHNPFSRLFKKR